MPCHNHIARVLVVIRRQLDGSSTASKNAPLELASPCPVVEGVLEVTDDVVLFPIDAAGGGAYCNHDTCSW